MLAPRAKRHEVLGGAAGGGPRVAASVLVVWELDYPGVSLMSAAGSNCAVGEVSFSGLWCKEALPVPSVGGHYYQ